jgi:hypothetical protein
MDGATDSVLSLGICSSRKKWPVLPVSAMEEVAEEEDEGERGA